MVHPRDYATSSGQVLSTAAWLDTHFAACHAEYTAMLASVGIREGAHVLDAGCGAGSYLPLLAEIVGPGGSVTAVDLAVENVASVHHRAALLNAVVTAVATLPQLPFGDAVFDAVWCANTSQFFTDTQLLAVLAEFRRVVRPGGLVAIKDVDMQLARLHPADPFLVSHLNEVSVRRSDAGVESHGSLRGRELRRWLERAGLQQVWQRTTLIERWAPLAPVERQLWLEWMGYLAQIAEERGVPERDLPAWRAFADPESAENPINQPDFYACEGQVVAAGRVPAADSQPSV